jgi:hypothetical protein
MARDDAQEPSDDSSAGGDRPQDPIVRHLRPDPSQPPEQSAALTGFLGDSDREGFRRLYFTRDLDYYAEFRVEDVLRTVAIPAEEQPFAGEEATRVTLRRAAQVEYTRIRTALPLDEFDLDIRLGGQAAAQLDRPVFLTGPGDTFCGDCPATPGTCAETCGTCATDCGTCATNCATCGRATCGGTCATDCGTCGRATCGEATCVTCQTCGRATCEGTCATACGTCFDTCGTCATCRGATCGEQTCDTCFTNCGTCGNQTCVTCSKTCQDTCGPTCFTCPTCEGHTCDDTCAGPNCFLPR